MRHRCALPFCALILLTALAADTVTAGGAFTTFSSDQPVDFRPSAVTRPDANGFWATGIVPDQNPNFAHQQIVLVRYRNDGSVALARAVTGHFDAFPLTLAPLPDGGVLFGGGDPSTCQLNRYDASGSLRWHRLVATPPRPGPVCSPVSIDGSGGVWVNADPVYRLSADGAIEAQVAFNGWVVNDLVGDPSGANAYLIGTDSSAYAAGRAVVERVSEHGDVLWRATPAPGTFGSFERGAALPDGSIYAFGEQFSANLQAFYAVKLGSDGHVAWQHTNDAQRIVYTEGAAIGNDGNALVAYRGGDSGGMLAKTGSNGAFAWSLPLPAINNCIGLTRVSVAANGDALLACSFDNADPYTGYVLRVSTQGRLIFSRAVPGVQFADVQAFPDFSELSRLQHFPAHDSLGNPIAGSDRAELDHFDATGAALTSPQTKGIVDVGGKVAAALSVRTDRPTSRSTRSTLRTTSLRDSRRTAPCCGDTH